MAKGSLSREATSAQNDLAELRRDHDDFVRCIDKAEDALNGIYVRSAEVAQWNHSLTPRYVQHIVETTIASLIDPDLKFQIDARPKFYDADEFQRVRDGAKALEWLLDFQLKQDRFSDKQRDMMLQERIAGISWAKVYWKKSTRMRKRLVSHETFPQMEVTEEPETIYDAPCVEVCNNRDLVWDMGATSIASCPLIGHRVWVTYQEAKMMERKGAWKNVDELKDSERGPGEGADKRKQGRFEVWEIWRRESNGKIRVYTIGEERVLLSEKENPYWHGEFPFHYFSSRKKPLMLQGWSQVEMLQDIQKQLWSVSNLRLDALMLSIMPIIMYRDDVDDVDALVFEPYARWPVTDPNQVRMWTPEYNQAQVSIPAEQILKADLQNISGSQPFTSTDEARTAGANTATEASLVASIAQKSMGTVKTHWYQTCERIGQQFLELDQQYVREPVFKSVIDIDQPMETQVILPEVLQGEFNFSIKPMTESLIRQERRAEATAHFQALMQVLPMTAQLSMMTQGQVPAMDPWAVLGDYLEAFDKGSVEKYQVKQLPAPQPMGSQAAPQDPNAGTTNQALANGPLAQGAIGPMQQFGAAMGGGQSVGG